MRFLSIAKDGGPQSTVTGYWLIELKRLFSVVLLEFEDGSRDEFHEHAFDSLNWIIKGTVTEQFLDGEMRPRIRLYGRSPWPILTRRSRWHRVVSHGTTWVLSLRGPWKKTWREWDPKTMRTTTLTHGRKIVHGPQF